MSFLFLGAQSKRFFDLPLDIKLQALHPEDGTHHRGFSPKGREKIKQDHPLSADSTEKGDQKETFDLGKSHGINQLSNIWLPKEVERACNLDGIRDFYEEFFDSCYDFQTKLLEAVSIGLMGLKYSNYLNQFHQEFNNQIRLAYYPSVVNSSELRGSSSDDIQRFGIHSDFGTLTILFQDQVGGLEVESPAAPGEFVPVKPIPGTVVVNVGDLLMRWSNDVLKSTLHRVKAPKVGSNVIPARYSIPYFIGPDQGTLIECLPEAKDPPKYPPIRADDYINSRMKASY